MTSRILIEQFYEKIKKRYPDLTLDDVGRICSSPFHFMNRAIIGDLLPVIRIKYLGIFSVKQKRAEMCKLKFTNIFRAGKMSEKGYLKEIAKLDRVLNRPEETEEKKPDVQIDDDL